MQDTPYSTRTIWLDEAPKDTILNRIRPRRTSGIFLEGIIPCKCTLAQSLPEKSLDIGQGIHPAIAQKPRMNLVTVLLDKRDPEEMTEIRERAVEIRLKLQKKEQV